MNTVCWAGPKQVVFIGMLHHGGSTCTKRHASQMHKCRESACNIDVQRHADVALGGGGGRGPARLWSCKGIAAKGLPTCYITKDSKVYMASPEGNMDLSPMELFGFNTGDFVTSVVANLTETERRPPSH